MLAILGGTALLCSDYSSSCYGSRHFSPCVVIRRLGRMKMNFQHGLTTKVYFLTFIKCVLSQGRALCLLHLVPGVVTSIVGAKPGRHACNMSSLRINSLCIN